MEPNLPLLRKVFEWAETEAEKPPFVSEWNNATWRETGLRKLLFSAQVEGACDTTYCQAGYAAQVTGAEWVSEDWVKYDPDIDGNDCATALVGDAHIVCVAVQYRAQRLLGISEATAHKLFYAGTDIEQIRPIYQRIFAEAGDEL